jgi:hypothetical protein
MTRVVLVAWCALAQAPSPPTDDALAARRIEYADYHLKCGNNVDAHWRLALWCEKNGLTREAQAEYASIVKLDPKRESAWHALGYKKHQHRWMTDAQIAEEAEQIKADKLWYPRLLQAHAALRARDTAKRDDASAVLLKIDDPRAVPAVWVTFVSGGEGDQALAVTILGQIRSKSSSRALAALAVFSPSEELRRRATETLRSRPPEEYAGPVVRLLQLPFTYRVKTMSGKTRTGELIVNGEKFSFQSFYRRNAAERATNFGDVVAYDGFGSPTLTHLGSAGRPTVLVDENGNPQLMTGKPDPNSNEALIAPKAVSGPEAQLENDIAFIEQTNAAIARSNTRLIATLKDLTGKDVGNDVASCRAWLYELEEKMGRHDPLRVAPPDAMFLILLTPPSHPVLHGSDGCRNIDPIR